MVKSFKNFKSFKVLKSFKDGENEVIKHKNGHELWK